MIWREPQGGLNPRSSRVKVFQLGEFNDLHGVQMRFRGLSSRQSGTRYNLIRLSDALICLGVTD